MTTMASITWPPIPEWRGPAAGGVRTHRRRPAGHRGARKLETYDLVINETLRMQTPLPFNFRRAVRDTDLLGHFIPAGTDVVTWPAINHRLPELWTDPERFDPMRFAEPRNEHKSHRYAFAPFGGGAHKCIGMVFGQLRSKTVMHRMMRRYRLELPHPDTGHAGITAACRFRSTECRSCCVP